MTGSGQADKAQVTAMVTRLLRLPAPPRPADAADALALAICHIWRGGTQADRGRAAAAAARRVQAAEERMIASVRGRVAAVVARRRRRRGRRGRPARALHPGARSPTLRLGEQARLATSLVVREDSLTLYGFADDDARELFELLQTASGVGPRLAQAVLAVHAPDVVRKAIATGDIGGADPGAGHRQEGRRAAGAGAARQDRPGRRRRRRPSAAGGRQRLARTRSARRWSGSAGPRRQADQAVAAVAGRARR